jgi:hypothetical protein
MAPRACWIVVVLALGCLTEAPGVTPCPIGSDGCPCTSGGACDGMLECHPEAKECYDPACMEGTENCPCFEDMCFGSLVCEMGLCHAPVSGTSGGSSEPATTEGSTAMSADATGDASQGTTGAAEGECYACFIETAPMMCTEEFPNCTEGGMCGDAWSCVTAGGSFAECCVDIGDGMENWNALAACVDAMGCLAICDGVITSCH